MARVDWTENQIRQAVELYLVTPFGKIHSRNPDIIQLANAINRTPSAVALKLSNLASIDETLDRKGMSNYSKLDKAVWGEFFRELKYATLVDVKQDSLLTWAAEKPQDEYIPDVRGENILRLANARRGQDFFRKMVLSSYDYKCAITGISHSDLLVAGHIKTWAADEDNRMNPRNGLCLNRLHDKAFEVGLIAINHDNNILYSPKLGSDTRTKMEKLNDGGVFAQPHRFKPDPFFLEYHREKVFQR